jgi:hypothetical protein
MENKLPDSFFVDVITTDFEIIMLHKKLKEFLENQELLDPEFTKVMDEMLTAKIGNKPTKKREW